MAIERVAMNEVKQIEHFCEENGLTPPEEEMMMRLADLCRKFPQHPDTKKLMAQVAVIRLDGIRQSISIIDKILQESEVSDGHELLYMMGKALGIKLTAEGLRLGRLWGDVIVRDDDPEDPKSTMFGFVGYKLGEAIYLETDEKIKGDQIDDYHARKLFKSRNGGPEKSPEGSV